MRRIKYDFTSLEDIFYDLLFSSQRGYINLHSKNAIFSFLRIFSYYHPLFVKYNHY